MDLISNEAAWGQSVPMAIVGGFLASWFVYVVVLSVAIELFRRRYPVDEDKLEEYRRWQSEEHKAKGYAGFPVSFGCCGYVLSILFLPKLVELTHSWFTAGNQALFLTVHFIGILTMATIPSLLYLRYLSRQFPLD